VAIYQKGDDSLEFKIKKGFLFLKEQQRVINLNNVKEVSIVEIDEVNFMVEAKLNALSTDYSVEEKCKPIKVSSPESLEIETFKTFIDAERFIEQLYDAI